MPEPASQTAPVNVLDVANVEVIYNHVILVLKGVSLDGARGQHRGAAGRQRCRQVDDPEGDLQPAAGRARRGHQGPDPLPRRAGRRPHAQRPGAARRHPGDGRPPLLRPSHGRGEFADRRLHPRQQAPPDRRRSREGLSLFPAPQGPAHQPGRLHVGRRAADDGDRPRPDEPAHHHPARRAVDGARPAARRGDLRDRRGISTSASGSRSCWPNRTPTWRCATPITAISWRTAASCSTATPRVCARTRT